ncbi:MAG: O-antigen ligase family protein [Candidatus Sulfotelmatobacter sp.]
MATLAAAIDKKTEREKTRNTLAYGALLLFTFLYYTRPEELIPGLGFIPLEKIIGGVAVIALIVTLASGRSKRKFPLEFKLLLLLFAHLTVAIPFAYWRMGAFAVVFEKFSKGVVVAFLVTLVIDNFMQLRRLLWVQAAAMMATTVASIAIHHTDQGRLIGALGGIFENPNDLAINIAINWPLCLVFVLLSKGMGKTAVWTMGILAMLLGVVLTYSRSGLLAIAVAVVICLWQFGIKGKRFYLIAGALILSVVAAGVVMATPHYLARVASIFRGNIEGSGDRGSWEARRALLVDSIEEAIHHPIFGIGAGNFGAATLTWRVTHNTYTELAAEGGSPALILFLAILYLSLRNLRRIRLLPAYRENPEIRLFNGALWASLLAFAVGALFASFEYHIFPYFMMAYTSVLYRLVSEQSSQCANETPGKPPTKGSLWKRYADEDIYGNDRTKKLDRTR